MLNLQSIAVIIREENICPDWQLDEEQNAIFLYFEDFDICIINQDNKLYSIFKKKIKHFKKELKLLLDDHNPLEEFFIHGDTFYVQNKYSRFSKDIIFYYFDLYDEITQYLKKLKNPKKNIIKYNYNKINQMGNKWMNYFNLETNQISNSQ